MITRKLGESVTWLAAVDWERKLFDELIPLPEGTSYNSYVVRGGGKTALVDTSDPSFTAPWLDELDKAGVKSLDYVVANHAEQDHSGSLPAVLARFPASRLVTTPKGKDMLPDLLDLPADRIVTVGDGETLALGGKTLKFIHFPWVHWPETMLTFLEEERILFPCDLFGSHLATGAARAEDDPRWMEAERRYYAEIMMPFRKMIAGGLSKVRALNPALIAPSHGPAIGNPASIMDAYADWTSDRVENRAVIAYVSMHDSTRLMVRHLEGALSSRGVRVDVFRLAGGDIGKLAALLIDAATVVIGTPTVLGGAHPAAAYAAMLANLIRPKARFAAVVGSFGWGGKAAEQLVGLMPALKVEVAGTVMAKGLPREKDFAALDALAATIAEKHKGL